jgi:hypothetical protein
MIPTTAPPERMGKLSLLRQPARDFDQGAWVTSMARRAEREHAADWIINSDSDEFWWPQSGDFKSLLRPAARGERRRCAESELSAVEIQRPAILRAHPGS